MIFQYSKYSRIIFVTTKFLMHKADDLFSLEAFSPHGGSFLGFKAYKPVWNLRKKSKNLSVIEFITNS